MPVIKGIQKTTLVDYPGKIAATIFTSGCNFRCSFCHNVSLVDEKTGQALPNISEPELLEYLAGRTKQLDGICVSGGEPTLHADLPDFIKKIKALGYSIKLDTNGTNPAMLEQLLNEKLLDYIAMDIKGPLELYPKIINTALTDEMKTKIKQSIALIINSGVAHEFRTTVLPVYYAEKDIENMGCLIRGADNYYLQQFKKNAELLDPQFKEADCYSPKALANLAEKFLPYVKKVKVRGAA